MSNLKPGMKVRLKNYGKHISPTSATNEFILLHVGQTQILNKEYAKIRHIVSGFEYSVFTDEIEPIKEVAESCQIGMEVKLKEISHWRKLPHLKYLEENLFIISAVHISSTQETLYALSEVKTGKHVLWARRNEFNVYEGGRKMTTQKKLGYTAIDLDGEDGPIFICTKDTMAEINEDVVEYYKNNHEEKRANFLICKGVSVVSLSTEKIIETKKIL